jgi:hypothetical protein
MENKTESYIVLKPIAERFNRIAKEITDEDIKQLIKSELREQLRAYDFGYDVKVIMDEWFDDEKNVESVQNMIEKSIKDRFK